MSEAIRISVASDGREVSHISMTLDVPTAAGADLCFVFLHGFGSDQRGDKARFFRRQALDEGHAFCTFDFRGHGESGSTMRELTLSRNVEDMRLVHEQLRKRELHSVVLIGSSMGGLTALWYSALHPEDVVAGCHIAPALGMEEGFLAWAGEAGAARWEREGVIEFKNEFVSCELAWNFIEDMRAFGIQRLLQTYKTPTLILQGKHDDSVPWRNVVNFVTRCAYEGIDLHLFADGDHRLTDRKERLWELMFEFLAGRDLL